MIIKINFNIYNKIFIKIRLVKHSKNYNNNKCFKILINKIK